MAQTQTYDYHPPITLPDPEAPEQSLGDCSICMDAILIDPTLQRGDDEKDQLLGLGRWGQAADMRKSYSLAPCHHLFVRPFLQSEDAGVYLISVMSFLAAHNMFGKGKPVPLILNCPCVNR